MTWQVTSGALPPGLTLNNQGVITGTPTHAGNYTFTVKVTDANDLFSMRKLTVVVNGLLVPALTTDTEQALTLGKPYQLTLQATGGKVPYTWSVPGGMLPAGLTLNTTTGVISGTPSKTGIYLVKVQVQGSNGATSAETITFDVLMPNQREVIWNGQIRNVPAIVRNEGTTATTYRPIWYVMQLLKPMGITSTWDGQHWYMATSQPIDLSNIQVGNGGTSMYLNGTLVQTLTLTHPTNE